METFKYLLLAEQLGEFNADVGYTDFDGEVEIISVTIDFNGLWQDVIDLISSGDIDLIEDAAREHIFEQETAAAEYAAEMKHDLMRDEKL